MQLISFSICPCHQLVASLLEVYNIKFNSEFLNLNSVPQWFISASPSLEPVIRLDNNNLIIGVEQIKNYLDQNFNLPINFDSNMSGDIEELCEMAIELYIKQCSMFRSPDLNSLGEATSEIDIFLKNTEEMIYRIEPCKKNKITYADLFWAPLLLRYSLMEEKTGHNWLQNYPRLKIWKHDLVKFLVTNKSISQNFDKEFEKYYLNGSTYLSNFVPYH